MRVAPFSIEVEDAVLDDLRARLELGDERLEVSRPCPELVAGELIGGAGGAGDEVRDADAVGRQRPVLVRAQLAWREPGGVQRGVEAVAGAGEVVADLGRAQRRVDAHEEHFQVFSQNVEHGP